MSEHPLLSRQLKRARTRSGDLDAARLCELVAETYAEFDRERRRSDHAIRKMVEELDHRAEHDALTGLANRTRFSKELRSAIRLAREGGRAAVLFLDLDRFKSVNDTMGHGAGDELLRAVARRLAELVGDRGVPARLGGDEFGVVQAQIGDPAQAAELAHEISRSLSEPYEIDGARVEVGVSVGISLAPEHGLSEHDLLRRADMALYRVKQIRTGSFCFFDTQMDEALTSRQALEAGLRDALALGRLELHLQPIVGASTRRVVRYEALLRWRDGERGLLTPDAFLAVAEASGLIVPIGEWVVRTACDIAARLPEPIALAINLSRAQLRCDNLVQVFQNALAESGASARRVEVEIAESLLFLQDSHALRTIDGLRALGLRLAIDDFGAGASTLNQLRLRRFDTIKLDPSFWAPAAADAASAAMVRAVAAFGRDLGIDIVAEAVEDRTLGAMLAELGCGLLQGFCYGRPVAAEDVLAPAEAAAFRARAALRLMSPESGGRRPLPAAASAGRR